MTDSRKRRYAELSSPGEDIAHNQTGGGDTWPADHGSGERSSSSTTLDESLFADRSRPFPSAHYPEIRQPDHGHGPYSPTRGEALILGRIKDLKDALTQRLDSVYGRLHVFEDQMRSLTETRKAAAVYNEQQALSPSASARASPTHSPQSIPRELAQAGFDHAAASQSGNIGRGQRGHPPWPRASPAAYRERDPNPQHQQTVSRTARTYDERNSSAQHVTPRTSRMYDEHKLSSQHATPRSQHTMSSSRHVMPRTSPAYERVDVTHLPRATSPHANTHSTPTSTSNGGNVLPRTSSTSNGNHAMSRTSARSNGHHSMSSLSHAYEPSDRSTPHTTSHSQLSTYPSASSPSLPTSFQRRAHPIHPPASVQSASTAALHHRRQMSPPMTAHPRTSVRPKPIRSPSPRSAHEPSVAEPPAPKKFCPSKRPSLESARRSNSPAPNAMLPTDASRPDDVDADTRSDADESSDDDADMPNRGGSTSASPPEHMMTVDEVIEELRKRRLRPVQRYLIRPFTEYLFKYFKFYVHGGAWHGFARSLRDIEARHRVYLDVLVDDFVTKYPEFRLFKDSPVQNRTFKRMIYRVGEVYGSWDEDPVVEEVYKALRVIQGITWKTDAIYMAVCVDSKSPGLSSSSPPIASPSSSSKNQRNASNDGASDENQQSHSNDKARRSRRSSSSRTRSDGNAGKRDNAGRSISGSGSGNGGISDSSPEAESEEADGMCDDVVVEATKRRSASRTPAATPRSSSSFSSDKPRHHGQQAARFDSPLLFGTVGRGGGASRTSREGARHLRSHNDGDQRESVSMPHALPALEKDME